MIGAVGADVCTLVFNIADRATLYHCVTVHHLVFGPISQERIGKGKDTSSSASRLNRSICGPVPGCANWPFSCVVLVRNQLAVVISVKTNNVV